MSGDIRGSRRGSNVLQHAYSAQMAGQVSWMGQTPRPASSRRKSGHAPGTAGRSSWPALSGSTSTGVRLPVYRLTTTQRSLGDRLPGHGRRPWPSSARRGGERRRTWRIARGRRIREVHESLRRRRYVSAVASWHCDLPAYDRIPSRVLDLERDVVNAGVAVPMRYRSTGCRIRTITEIP